MKSQKKHPNHKLQKSSIIFMQLGLVLALLFTYFVLETNIEKTSLTQKFTENTTEEPVLLTEAPSKFIIEKKKKVEKKNIKPKAKIIDKIIQKDNNDMSIEKLLEPVTDDDETDIDTAINNLPDDTSDDETDDIPQILSVLEQAPIFPGCENLSKEASKECFKKQISRFVNKKFDTDLASELGLNGKQRIFVQFVIDKKGNVVDIKARAPHKRLEKEASQIIEKLPKMKPGMQRTKAVPVKYTLPIMFEVYN